MPQPQVWQRRQEIPQQQATIGPALMERVERTNAEVVCPQQRIGLAQCNLYAMDVDKKKIGIVTTVGVLDTQQGIVEIGEQKEELDKKEDWNIGKIRITDKEG